MISFARQSKRTSLSELPSYSAADAASLRQMLGILFFSQILSLGMLAIYWGLRSSAEILSAFVHDTDGNSFVNSPLHACTVYDLDCAL